MKNIYISADIEGIWGNVNGAYTMPGVPEYEQYRRRMIDEVNIAAKALFKHGAQTILVNDGHGNMDTAFGRADPRPGLPAATRVQGIWHDGRHQR
ncbi:MAG: M55 family metallopeptidase [Merdibacter sp.]